MTVWEVGERHLGEEIPGQARNDYWWARNDYGWRCPIRSGMTVQVGHDGVGRGMTVQVGHDGVVGLGNEEVAGNSRIIGIFVDSN